MEFPEVEPPKLGPCAPLFAHYKLLRLVRTTSFLELVEKGLNTNSK